LKVRYNLYVMSKLWDSVQLVILAEFCSLRFGLVS
jgi:hypothetical protein